MRIVDILYGLPYILLIILLKIALEPALNRLFQSRRRVQHGRAVPGHRAGQLADDGPGRSRPGAVAAARRSSRPAGPAGLTERRIFFRHLLPNLVGPITVYATLTIPQAILQESFLSFLGIGIQPPLPTLGFAGQRRAAPALSPIHSYWWLLVFPCTLLAVTLLSLNFLGDGLRDVFDPRTRQRCR